MIRIENIQNKTVARLLIAGLTPYFLERGFSWWEENESEIIKKRSVNPFWQNNSLVAETDQAISQGEFLRKLTDLGYEKTMGEVYPGTFKHLGGEIIIYPPNKPIPYAIDFSGNKIESIEEQKSVLQKTEQIKIKKEVSLRNGDYVVHIDHGIGILRNKINRGGESFFKIEYGRPRTDSEPDALFVPEDKKDRIEPYLGINSPRISRLGTPLWSKTKRKAKEDIIEFAKKLIGIYQTRSKTTRSPYHGDSAEKEVWDKFPYDLTPDQEKAVSEIFKDLSGPEPMERLLMGDVGFGKTELALRAVLRVALSGKQAMIITPTTVLTDQHFQVFDKRFRKLPLNIRRLTRLETKRESKKTVEGLAEGKVDIIIGTHRALSKDIYLKNPGLLVIDEEQRFGVRHKEYLKEKYPEIDILSLSATPIPRTLAFSLAGVRKMSTLKNSPAGRQASVTKVLPFSKKTIGKIIEFEVKREGQIYYLANRIHQIPKIKKLLDELAPNAKKGTIHGRMKEGEIIETMRAFREGKTDILISTTIIENGLDISNANTLIVENAVLLGLAQAHQIRGRIGRGSEKAFSYFLFNPRHLPEKAQKRLHNLMELSKPGSGPEIAKRDLDMRGSGNLLGKEQAGIANKIGWNLYFQFINEAIENIKGS